MAKAKSGGGIGMNKNTSPTIRAGSRNTQAVNEREASEIGRQVVKTQHVEMFAAKAAATPMGNELATNVGKGGPGTGRTVFDCGTQGTHGKKGS